MNRFIPHWLRKPWIPTLIALALLALLIWFWAPLLEAGSGLRWMLIALLAALVAAWFAVRLWLAWRRHRALMDGMAPPASAPPADIAPDPAAADLAALGQRMRAALAVLRTANPGWRMRGRYLYELPWYVFVGAPGSGKTTALTRSGLEFPLAETLGPEAIGGIGGTRHCDWWFTDEAVLLDTAGRYTTQDSQLEVDRAAWSGFLGLLRKHRPRRPINGVIVTISVADLLLQPRSAREAQARAVRARIQELQERLGLAFPVYVIVTKSDLLAGFTEFFEPLGREERAQVWGMTFSLADSAGPAPAPALAAFPAEFRALETQLQLRMLERMQQERDLGRRALIHGFPRQFAALEDALENFLQAVFSANRFEQPALLRGVYFTSGTQEGNPIDRVMSSLAASFGLRDRALPPRPESGRSYFLTRLMRDVIFREAGLAGLNSRAERRRRLLQWGVLAGGAGLALLLATALSISYVRNTRLIEESDAAVAALAREGAAFDAAADGDELGVLPLLEAARALPAGYAQRERDVALLERMGLYQGEKLGDGAQAAYRRLLRTTLETRIVARMENVLRRGDADGQDLLYETLRIYLMLGQRQHFDPAAVQAWVELEWERGLAGAGAAERAQLAAHLEALLEQGDTPEPVQLDVALVAQARQALAGMSLSERIYGVTKRQVAQEVLPEFSVSRALGRDASGVLARASGEPLGRGVNGLYSVAGYRRFAQLSWLAVADIARDDWVLARREASGGPQGAAAAREAVLQLYFADYIRAWDVFLGDLRLAPLASLDDAARVSNALGGADSALRTLLAGAARETALAAVKADGLPPGVGKLVQDKFGKARRQLQAVFGAPQQSAPPPRLHPVDTHFAPLHRLVKGPAPTQLEQMLALVRDAALYFDAAEGARRSGAPAPAPDALVRLKRAGEGQAAPLPVMFKGIHDAGAGLAQGGERARLNALWNAGPAQFCRDAIAGRYPVDRASARDATADDFGKFFAPAGLMDDFFTRNLATFVDMGGARWRWRAAGSLAGASQAALDAFQRGARLRDMFFAGGARQPTLRFTLRPLAVDPAISSARFEIDGQEVAAAGQAAVSLLLPSGKGNGGVRLSAPGVAAELRSDGPWAWLRTLDRGVLEPLQPERYRLGLSLDGRKASWELTAGSVINPFRRDVTGFVCPAAL